MNADQLYQSINKKKSFLCVGLDSDLAKIPDPVQSSKKPQFEFNRKIIDATSPYAVAYKLNAAFYEARGAEGWSEMEETVKYLRGADSSVLIIADAKRGDIGNTSEMYARAFFDKMDCDAITLSPYMGYDVVVPFLKRTGKWIILLAVTSNKGAEDFQFLELSSDGTPLYENILRIAREWGSADTTMFVAGATRPEIISKVREYVPDHFLLVPGIGAQGGSLEAVARYGMNSRCGLLVNSSRGIIFASQSESFAEAARDKAIEIQKDMESLLVQHKLI
jgi:orotidine-5'-phosphate decarboxylase